jgi:hypothetical protein
MLIGAFLVTAVVTAAVALTVPRASVSRNVVQTRLYPFWNEAGERVGYVTPSISP